MNLSYMNRKQGERWEFTITRTGVPKTNSCQELLTYKKQQFATKQYGLQLALA